MEHPHFIIAFTGNEQTGKEVLFKSSPPKRALLSLPACGTCPAPMVIFHMTAAAIRQ